MNGGEMFVCACQTDAVSVEYDRDADEYNLACWSLHGFDLPSWRQRLRQAWQVLRTGKPYSDMVVLSTKDAERLSWALRKHVKPTVVTTTNPTYVTWTGQAT